METSFPGHITTVDQEEPPRQMGRGEDREPSRTISAGFPPRSGFVQHNETRVRCGPELVVARRSMRLISRILASRATMLAPILAATPNNVRTNSLRIVGLARVLAHGIVESPWLRMTKRRAFLRALSQNRASASRVSLC